MIKFEKIDVPLSKVDYLVSRRGDMTLKQTLLDLLTTCDRPLFSLPEHLFGQAAIKLTIDKLHDAIPYLESGIFHAHRQRDSIVELIGESHYAGLESVTNLGTLLNVADNTGKNCHYLQLDNKLIITSNHQFNFNLGDIGPVVVDSKVGPKVYLVTLVRHYRHEWDHPYQSEMVLHSSGDIRQVGKPYWVAVLIPYLEGTKSPPSKEYATYAVFGSNIPPGDDPRRGPVEIILVKLSDRSYEAPFKIYDKFDLHTGMIENFVSKEPILTTVGLYILNATILVSVFGDMIPYIQSKPGSSDFSPSKVDDMVASLLQQKKINKSHYDRYIQVGYFIGHLTSISVPGLSLKALGTDPNMAKRAKELYSQYKDQLDDPVTVTKIEEELINMDKAYIAGDSAERYYAVSPKQSYNEHRKKMFSTIGLSPSFVKGAASYTVIQTSLAEGWKPDDLPEIANEIRRGTYDRGISTAKGGEQTKFILRLFNATTIVEDDCGSNDGNTVLLTEDNISQYYDRYIVASPGVYLQLKTDDISDYIGKEVIMRSPQCCTTKKGLCFKCCGERFKMLDSTAIGLTAVKIGSKMMAINMKSMHFSGVNYLSITDISPFLVF